jgi:signal peptidase II
MRPVARSVTTLLALTLLVGCDHATKLVAKSELEGSGVRPLVRGVLDLRYTENTDVAFNLLRAMPERTRVPLLLAVGGVAVLGLVGVLFFMLARRSGTGVTRAAMLLVTAGALGNYLDRVVRGYVVDFVHLAHWPVFNVADAYVTAGGVLLLAYAFQRRRAPA